MYLGLGESLSTIYCIKYIIFLFLFILNQKLKKKNQHTFKSYFSTFD